jgi:F-type H+-transporting ATPase subunit b
MAEPIHAVSLAEVKGTTELHVEPSAWGINAAGWVALSMLVVVALMLWKKVPQLITGMLDTRIAAIRQQLDEAAQLRAEAERLLADAKARSAASAGDAAAIVAHAEAEAQALLAKAQADAADLVARRGRMAEDKIGAAERSALAEVRARAADAAVRAAGALIAERHDAAADRTLTDRTIAGLGRLN